MLEQLIAASLIISASLAGLALGVSGSTVVQIAPVAFKRLDYQEADGLVRNLVKVLLPWIVGFAVGAGVFALVGTAIGSGIILLCAGGMLLFVRWVLDPLPKKPRAPGARRKKSKQRILALQIMAMITLMFPAALLALALRI
ncbi:MAG: hypothetical protein PVI23_12685 [Maricaulaceae bacterium]|jgi:hypothetical protein